MMNDEHTNPPNQGPTDKNQADHFNQRRLADRLADLHEQLLAGEITESDLKASLPYSVAVASDDSGHDSSHEFGENERQIASVLELMSALERMRRQDR